MRLNPPRDTVPTPGQRWWREKRLPQVEERAYQLLRSYERKRGGISGCVVPPELLVSEIGCELIYFSDAERKVYGIPWDAIGELRPFDRIIYIHDSIEVPGREGQTIGEEIGHFVLHAVGLPAPGQLALIPETDLRKRESVPRFFRITDRGLSTEARREPAWMSREAAFFSACLQMPRDRYLPVARWRLRQALNLESPRCTCWLPLEEKVSLAQRMIDDLARADLDLADYHVLLPSGFDNAVIETALDLLSLDHKEQVSRAAQMRRFVELGLTVDAAQLLRSPDGQRLFPRWEFFFLTDLVLRTEEP